jgi:YggT family protein
VVLEVLRYAVFAVAAVSTAIAVGSWAVRTRRLDPFSRSARLVRRIGDPVLDPIETWLLKKGGSPNNAGWWLVGFAVGGGLVVITVADWLAGIFFVAGRAAAQGPAGILQLVVYYGSNVVILALFVRVFASWFGRDRFTPWMRPFFVLTDWIVQPLRRVVPPIGMIDITPIVAWFLILVIRNFLLRVIG